MDVRKSEKGDECYMWRLVEELECLAHLTPDRSLMMLRVPAGRSGERVRLLSLELALILADI